MDCKSEVFMSDIDREIAIKQTQLAALQKQIEMEKRQLYALQHPILAQLEDLDAEKSKANQIFHERREKIVNSCQHNWRHYEYERDNYDRDIETGYTCAGCKSDISVKSFNERYKK